jgi:hypothetical protein
LPADEHIGPGRDAEPNAGGGDRHHGDADVIADNHLFAQFAS